MNYSDEILPIFKSVNKIKGQKEQKINHDVRIFGMNLPELICRFKI